MYFQEFGASKAHFLYRSSMMQNYIRYCLVHTLCTTKTIQKEVKRLQDHQILAGHEVAKNVMVQYFAIVPDMICLCLDPRCLIQALIEPSTYKTSAWRANNQ